MSARFRTYILRTYPRYPQILRRDLEVIARRYEHLTCQLESQIIHPTRCESALTVQRLGPAVMKQPVWMRMVCDHAPEWTGLPRMQVRASFDFSLSFFGFGSRATDLEYDNANCFSCKSKSRRCVDDLRHHQCSTECWWLTRWRLIKDVSSGQGNPVLARRIWILEDVIEEMVPRKSPRYALMLEGLSNATGEGVLQSQVKTPAYARGFAM